MTHIKRMLGCQTFSVQVVYKRYTSCQRFNEYSIIVMGKYCYIKILRYQKKHWAFVCMVTIFIFLQINALNDKINKLNVEVMSAILF